MWVAVACAVASAIAQQRASTFVPAFRKPTISKCPSCGSREWVAHDGKEVCAYCRGDR